MLHIGCFAMMMDRVSLPQLLLFFYLFPIATKLKEVEQIIVNKEKTEEGKAQALKLQAKLNGEQELVFSIGRYTKKKLHFFQAAVCLPFHGYFF